MKNFKNILQGSLILLLTTMSCKNDDYEIPNTFTDASLTSSFGAAALKEGEVNKYYSFVNLSAGAVEGTSKWIIPKGAYFLKGPIPNSATNFDKFIQNAGDTISTDRTISVLFKKGETNTKVKFYSEFKEETEYTFPSFDPVTNAQVDDVVRTELIDDKWVFEYTYELDVYDTVVSDAELRYLDETIIDYKNLDTLRVKFDDKIIIEDISDLVADNNARPNAGSIRLHTITDDVTDEVNLYNSNGKKIDTIQFNKQVGTFKLELTSQRHRTETVGESTDVLTLPMVFKVSQLDEDFTIQGNVVESDIDVIQIQGSSKFAEITGDISSNFELTVDGVVRTINTVSLNSTNANKLDITLDEVLVPADKFKTVQISYDGLADLRSLDDRVFKAFTAQDITVYEPTPINQSGSIIETTSDIIQISFDQEIDPQSIINSLNPGLGFDVMVNGSTETIATISVNSEDPKVLDITLTNGVYRNDVITIAFTEPGEIKSVGGGTISNFAAITVGMNDDNLLGALGSFEGDFTTNYTNASTSGGATVVIEAPVGTTAPKGDQVLVFSAPDGGKSVVNTISTFPFDDTKTYIVKFKRYVKTGTDTTRFAKFLLGGKVINDQFSTTPSLDAWHDYQFEFVPAASTNTTLKLQTTPAGASDIYYDDIIIQEKNERP